ncbi:uncharacterized protein LOC118456207 [Anopheles albimanus]|uniref:Uncharacterized protein n=1 Tax=Anopheles albimanus TaxID=7167 RepID=A0A182FSF1_ANOAL|nr:uncharacterized protein LOC118456207 [Anopheles albimanus]
MDQVQLKSNDGEMLTVESNILAGSAVLQNRLQKLQTPKIENAFLVVPEANANLLKLVLDWLRNHKDQDPHKTPEETSETGDKESSNNQQNHGIGPWEQEFFTNNLSSILLVMAVAKRLSISSLLTVAGSFVFAWIRSNSLQKFFETAGINVARKEGPAAAAPAGKEKNESNDSQQSKPTSESCETDQSEGSVVNESATGEEDSDYQIVEATEPSSDVIPDVIPEEVPEVVAQEVPEPEVIPETAPIIAEDTVTVADE